MSDVFISYAREDRAHAESIADGLHELGLSVFWDRVIPTGRTFEDVIEEEMAAARAVVVLWSKYSVRSNWVRAEASEAASRGILVPASLDGTRAPLRYRIAQTADLAQWTPGSRTQAFTAFLNDVARTTRAVAGMPSGDGWSDSTHRANRDATTADQTAQASMRRLLKASMVFAWIGSIALALTIAYDYGLLRSAGALYTIAYFATIVSLAAGGLTAIAFGWLSYKRQWVAGVLQGWVWPVVAGVGELILLVNVPSLIGALPVISEFETLIAFTLCGAIGPSVLTASAVLTSRTLDAAR